MTKLVAGIITSESKETDAHHAENHELENTNTLTMNQVHPLEELNN
jgi:hypothetical protein